MSGCTEKHLGSKVVSFQRDRRPVVVGTGLIALDVLVNERTNSTPRLWTGGTCGNVLAILAYLGWRSIPVSRMARDPASRLIRRDLKRWGVELDYLSTEPTAAAPIIVHRIRENGDGEPFHSFSLHCPDCGRRLPGFRPITDASVESLLRVLPDGNVFFADRVSRGIVSLAETMKKRGAVVVFEPSSVTDESLFHEMLSLVDILKYSQERLADVEIGRTVPLIVETLGKGGLRYRGSFGACRFRNWVHCHSYRLNRFADTAGAGDWCTAGILHMLLKDGAGSFRKATPAKLQNAFAFGQALATWTCGFPGARGGMYEVEKQVFEKTVAKILADRSHALPSDDDPSKAASRVVPRVCSECRQTSKDRALALLMHG